MTTGGVESLRKEQREIEEDIVEKLIEMQEKRINGSD